MTAYYHLPTWVFEFGYNSRIVIMAVVSMYFLRRHYSFQKCISLVGISLMCSIMQWEESVYYGGNPERKQILLGLLALAWIVFCNVTASVLLEWILQRSKHHYRRLPQQQQQQVVPSDASASLLDGSSLNFWLCAVVYFTTTFICAVVKAMTTSSSTNDSSTGGYDNTNNFDFFYGFNGWTWLTILFRATSHILVLKVIQSTSCVMEFIATRVSVVSASITDIEASNITEGRYLIVILIATFVEFCFVYSYGVPRSKWPTIFKKDGESCYIPLQTTPPPNM